MAVLLTGDMNDEVDAATTLILNVGERESTMMELGKLEQVDPRTVWPHEALRDPFKREHPRPCRCASLST